MCLCGERISCTFLQAIQTRLQHPRDTGEEGEEGMIQVKLLNLKAGHFQLGLGLHKVNGVGVFLGWKVLTFVWESK